MADLGHTYAFFSSAVDVAGNAEPKPIADASVLVTAHPWHNMRTGRGLDVTDDGNIVADDVLSVINYINSKGSGRLPDSALPARFVDTDSDDNVTASDVIAVINFINARPSQSEGESESAFGPVSTTVPAASDNVFQADETTAELAAASAQRLAATIPDRSLTDLVSLLAADIFSQQAKRRRV